MLAFIAMNKNGVIPTVKNGREGSGDLVIGDGNEGLFVARNAELEESDAVLIEKAGVGLGILFEDEGENGAEAEGTEEREVFLFGKRGTVDMRIDHREIVWREEIFLKIRGCVRGRSVGGHISWDR